MSPLSRIAPLAAALLAACAPTAPPSAPSAALGTTVGFELPSSSGALVAVPQPDAAATLVDAFAPTCVPCATKVPALAARRGELANAGARLVLVAVLSDGESDADAARALSQWGAEGAAFVVDRGGALRRTLAIDTLPGAAVVDRAGKVRWVAPTNASVDDLVAAATASAR